MRNVGKDNIWDQNVQILTVIVFVPVSVREAIVGDPRVHLDEIRHERWNFALHDRRVTSDHVLVLRLRHVKLRHNCGQRETVTDHVLHREIYRNRRNERARCRRRRATLPRSRSRPRKRVCCISARLRYLWWRTRSIFLPCRTDWPLKISETSRSVGEGASSKTSITEQRTDERKTNLSSMDVSIEQYLKVDLYN